MAWEPGTSLWVAVGILTTGDILKTLLIKQEFEEHHHLGKEAVLRNLSSVSLRKGSETVALLSYPLMLKHHTAKEDASRYTAP